MNWGYKILFVYGVFVAGIMFMVLKSSTQKMDLVTTDYYAKELIYQEKIDEMNRVNTLSEEVKYEINKTQILLLFPKDFKGKKISGRIELYCPSDEGKDIKQDFNLMDSALVLKLNTGNKGQHELHITWQADNKNYYFEQKIFL